MVKKYPIVPDKVRRPPKHFSWVDHRLVRENIIDKCSNQASTLYLFLVTVADARGLSYYSDISICSRLAFEIETLLSARNELIRTGLVAYKRPLYQVLSLDPPEPSTSKRDNTNQQPELLGQILKQMAKEAR